MAKLMKNKSATRRFIGDRPLRLLSPNRSAFRLFMNYSGCLLVGASLAAQTPGDPREDAAIRGVVQKYVDARESKDSHAIELLFTTEADQLVSTGEWRKGRDAVVAGTLTSSQRSGGKRTITVESVRVISSGVAIVDGRYEIRGMANGENRKMWTTLILARGSDGWRIAAIRNMLPAPAAP